MTVYDSSEIQLSLGVLAVPYYLELEMDKTVLETDTRVIISGFLYESVNPASSDRRPIAGASVNLYVYIQGTTGGNWLQFGTVTTGSDGRFSVPWILSMVPGQYKMKATYMGVDSNIIDFTMLGDVQTTLTASLESNQVYLGEEFTVTGRLVDEDGNPLSGMEIRLNVTASTPNLKTYTDINGEFAFTASTSDVGITHTGNFTIFVRFPGATV